jgi:hypothetical protein
MTTAHEKLNLIVVLKQHYSFDFRVNNCVANDYNPRTGLGAQSIAFLPPALKNTARKLAGLVGFTDAIRRHL